MSGFGEESQRDDRMELEPVRPPGARAVVGLHVEEPDTRDLDELVATAPAPTEGITLGPEYAFEPAAESQNRRRNLGDHRQGRIVGVREHQVHVSVQAGDGTAKASADAVNRELVRRDAGKAAEVAARRTRDPRQGGDRRVDGRQSHPAAVPVAESFHGPARTGKIRVPGKQEGSVKRQKDEKGEKESAQAFGS